MWPPPLDRNAHDLATRVVSLSKAHRLLLVLVNIGESMAASDMKEKINHKTNNHNLDFLNSYLKKSLFICSVLRFYGIIVNLVKTVSILVCLCQRLECTIKCNNWTLNKSYCTTLYTGIRNCCI